MVWQHIKKETGLGILRIQPFRQQYKRPTPYLQIDTARVFYMGNRQPSNFFNICECTDIEFIFLHYDTAEIPLHAFHF